MLPAALESLISELGRLPGIGPRTAERLAFFLLKANRSQSTQLARSLEDLHANIRSCKTCFNLSENDLCSICLSTKRDPSVIAEDEEPLDVI